MSASLTFPIWFGSRHSGIPLPSAAAVLRLSEAGATVPFMARYRKEETGNLDEVAIRQVLEGKELWDEIVARQKFIVEEIERQQKLTPALKEQLLGTFDLTALEDLYLPYKQKRKTKAALAREVGLEPLATWLWECGHGKAQPAAAETPEARALSFCGGESGVPDVAAALQGAAEILIERIAEDVGLRQLVRAAYFDEGFVRTRRARAKPNAEGKDSGKDSRFENYFTYQERVAELRKPQSSHRYLAMRRGWMEEELVLSLGGPLPLDDEDDQSVPAEAPASGRARKALGPVVDPLLETLQARFEAFACIEPAFAGAALLRRCAKLALRGHVVPAIENEVHRALRAVADEAAIGVFAENVRKLLLSAPFGPKAVLGIDPGIRTGCKLAVIDGSGKYVGSGVIHLESPWGKASAVPVLGELVRKGGISAIAVGNGTAGRETESFVREALKLADLALDVPVAMVSESGASVYSASEVAREEFPDLDVTIRGAISIARRLQDPLAELVKIDPKSIGVGQYQHDVSPHALKKSLDGVVDSCVNQVGVNLNTASTHLLSHVSGIGPGLARAIVERRTKEGLFRSRAELLEVPRFSRKIFEQAAGFLRISEGANPLDNTGVHPERYGVLERLAAQLDLPVAGLLGAGVKLVKEARQLREELGAFTFDDIVRELEKPGRDPRAGFVAFAYRPDIHTLQDLRAGMICPGIVTNVTNFGAFVDIGVHQDGLAHISQLADTFVKDPRQVVNAGDRVSVRILDVNLDKKQIALSMRLKAERVSDGEAPQPRSGPGPRDAQRPGDRATSRPAGTAARPASRTPNTPPSTTSPGSPRTAAAKPFNNPFASLDKLRRS